MYTGSLLLAVLLYWWNMIAYQSILDQSVAVAAVKKRSVLIDDHATSVALEVAFWDRLESLARRHNVSLRSLIMTADRYRPADLPLTRLLRLMALHENDA
jgi:predicted DNA-binding ribbon-helix-helix protein